MISTEETHVVAFDHEFVELALRVSDSFQTQTQPAPKNDYSKAETWFAVPAGRMPAQSI